MPDRAEIMDSTDFAPTTDGSASISAEQLRNFVDRIERLARALFGDKSKYEITDTEFAARIPAVQNGLVDIAIVGMFVTPERMQQVDFSDVYFE